MTIPHPDPIPAAHGERIYVYRTAAIDPTDRIGTLFLGRYVTYNTTYPGGERLSYGRTLNQAIRRARRVIERRHRLRKPIDVSRWTR